MGWDDDHLHRFCIHGVNYGIAYVGGPCFGEDAASVSLSRFQFGPTERLNANRGRRVVAFVSDLFGGMSTLRGGRHGLC